MSFEGIGPKECGHGWRKSKWTGRLLQMVRAIGCIQKSNAWLKVGTAKIKSLSVSIIHVTATVNMYTETNSITIVIHVQIIDIINSRWRKA